MKYNDIGRHYPQLRRKGITFIAYSKTFENKTVHQELIIPHRYPKKTTFHLFLSVFRFPFIMQCTWNMKQSRRGSNPGGLIYYHSLSQMPGAAGPLSSRPSWPPLEVSTSVSLMLITLAASMFTALTFIVSTEGVIYVFFIICICFLCFTLFLPSSQSCT